MTVIKLKAVIDQLNENFDKARNLVLNLAKLLDKTKQCERSEICRRIKELLNDKIYEAKITGRWIEECLPTDYKRKYTKKQ